MIRKCYLGALVLVGILLTQQGIAFERNKPFLLPNTSEPIHYDLDLTLPPDYVRLYNGTVSIEIRVLSAARTLTLHANGIEIFQEQSYLLEGSRRIPISSVEYEADPYHYVKINTSELLKTGLYKLVLSFEGYYQHDTRGLFISPYLDENNKRSYIIATHFEPAKAREAFPCYDEPSLKTTFTVRITHPSGFHAISNGRILKRVNSSIDGYVTTTFEKSAVMSTYLLAFAVSDFETLVSKDDSGREYRLYVPPSLKNETQDSLKVSVETVKHLEALLKVKYSLPKLDGVVVPTFGGGMENWGLIVYGNTVARQFLNNSKIRRSTAELITHEISHQWFGNLVTLAWWDFVWLNEAFATHYSCIIGDKILPEDRFMYYHIVVSLQNMLLHDSLSKNSIGLNDAVDTPKKFSSKFDSWNYQKGSGIVRMMSRIFPNYNKAITDYLNAKSYNNAEPPHLFGSIEAGQNGLPRGATVPTVMRAWVDNPGYPLITLNITKLPSGIFQYAIKQERFLLDRDSQPHERWWIPITMAQEKLPNFDSTYILEWLRDTDDSIVLYVEEDNGWTILNLQLTVFCRVNYDIANWQKLITFLKGENYTKIHVVNRAQLIDDSAAFCGNGYLDCDMHMDLLSYLEKEEDELPHLAAGRAFKRLGDYLRETEAFTKYFEFLSKIYDAKKAEAILEKPNFDELVAEMLKLMSEKNKDALVIFNEIAERSFSLRQYDSIRDSVRRLAPTFKNEIIDEFIERIEPRIENNIKAKAEFIKYEYKNVQNWLNRRF